MTLEQMKKIEEMFDDGHGAPTIARVLQISYQRAVKHLKATGRYRTHAEAHAVRVNNKPKRVVRL